jgi:SAM-dependent methyltransferase
MGCGSGLLASKLVEWYPETRFTLVDHNGAMLELARERLGDAPSITIHESTGEDFLAATDSADMSVWCRSWYALADPQRAAADLVRVLEPGSLIFIYDFEDLIDFKIMDESIGSPGSRTLPGPVRHPRGVQRGRRVGPLFPLDRTDDHRIVGERRRGSGRVRIPCTRITDRPGLHPRPLKRAATAAAVEPGPGDRSG